MLGLFVELIGSGKIKTVKNFMCVTVNCCMQEYISVKANPKNAMIQINAQAKPNLVYNFY